jgi:hypothetical protein
MQVQPLFYWAIRVVVFIAICGSVPAQETRQQVKITFHKAQLLAAERLYQKSVKAYLVSETDSILVYQPTFDTTLLLTALADDVKHYSDVKSFKDKMRDFKQRKANAHSDSTRLAHHKKRHSKITIKLIEARNMGEGTRKKRFFAGYPIFMDSTKITLLLAGSNEDTLSFYSEEIAQIRLHRKSRNGVLRGALIGGAVTTLMGTGMILTAPEVRPCPESSTANKEDLLAFFVPCDNWVGPFIQNLLGLAFIPTGFMIGSAVGASQGSYVIRGDKQKYLNALQAIGKVKNQKRYHK